MRRLGLVAIATLALAGCGGGSRTTTSTTTTVATPDAAAAMRALFAKHPELRGDVTILFASNDWAVVQSSRGTTAHAVVFRNVDGSWVADLSGRVKVHVLGPQPGTVAPALPQIAIGIASKLPFVDTGLWIDGKELFEKGGGSPTRGTIYGAPTKRLKPGMHVAAGYARSIANGNAVAWVFRTG